MRKVIAGVMVAALLAVVGCVLETKHTIQAHITLDIRHIEQQADTVLDFIEGKKEELPVEQKTDGGQSRLQPAIDFLWPMPVVHADRELNAVSPLARQIAEKLRERNPEIAALKQQGCLGENNRGYVELRDCDALSDADKRNAAQKTLADENKDRKALYNEIARLNKDQGNVTVSMVEAVYAMRRLERADTGEIFQLPPEGKTFDDFKASALGQKLGDQCKPGAWVTIP
jgi:uncharacterized protein